MAFRIIGDNHIVDTKGVACYALLRPQLTQRQNVEMHADVPINTHEKNKL